MVCKLMSWSVTLLRLNRSFSVVLGTLPFAIATTGHSSFDIDLTAPIMTGKDIGELRLETGACLLIELLSLLTSLTRCQTLTPSREIMEQKTVMIAKAGIYTSLNARCGVTVVTNPIYRQVHMFSPLLTCHTV